MLEDGALEQSKCEQRGVSSLITDGPVPMKIVSVSPLDLDCRDLADAERRVARDEDAAVRSAARRALPAALSQRSAQPRR